MEEIVQMRSFYESNDLSNDLYEMIKMILCFLLAQNDIWVYLCIDYQLYDIVAYRNISLSLTFSHNVKVGNGNIEQRRLVFQ